jgi:hypothetical protein
MGVGDLFDRKRYFEPLGGVFTGSPSRNELSMSITVRPIAAAATLLVLAACEPASLSTTSPRMATVHLYLTDAPSDKIASAVVRISRAYLVPAGEDGGGFETIFDGPPEEYDLLTLRDGVRELLASTDIPEGEYAQLRLVVDEAEIELVEGLSFADGSQSRALFVPSGMQTGIKVAFSEPLVIDGETSLLVDFDVDQNFVFQGPEAAPHGVLFTPVLHGVFVED